MCGDKPDLLWRNSGQDTAPFFSLTCTGLMPQMTLSALTARLKTIQASTCSVVGFWKHKVLKFNEVEMSFRRKCVKNEILKVSGQKNNFYPPPRKEDFVEKKGGKVPKVCQL